MMIVMMWMVNLPGFRSASWIVVKTGFEEDQGCFFQVSRHCWLLLVVISLRITIIMLIMSYAVCVTYTCTADTITSDQLNIK